MRLLIVPMQPERVPQDTASPERRTGKRQGGRQSVKVHPIDASSAFIWRGPDYPLLSPGQYTVRGRLTQGPEWVPTYRRWSLRVEFALVDEVGSVSAFFNFGQNRNGGKLGRHSRYFKAWVTANGELPKRGQAMTPDVFLEGQFFQVEVANCDTDSEGNPKPDAEVYSRITKIISARWP